MNFLLTIQVSYFLFFTYVKSSRSTMTWKENLPQINNFSSFSFLSASPDIRMPKRVHPSKHLLVLKTSSRRLQDMPWRRLQHVFSVTILRLPRRLGRRKIVTLKTSWRRLEDMSWRHVLKTCLEDLLKILWRQTKYLLGISVYLSRDLTNLNVYLTSLYFTNLYLTTLKRIQNALITGDWFGVMKLA